MALFPRVKTWSVTPNLIQAATGTRHDKAAGFAMLVTGALVGGDVWEVRGSSDGTTAALDGVDRLDDLASFVGSAAGAHSWMVLRQTATGLELCVDWNIADPTEIDKATIVIARQPFVGGTTSARPTAPQEAVLQNQTAWVGDGFGAPTTAQVMSSSDGLNSMVVMCSDSCLVGLWLFGAIHAPVGGWTNPLFGATLVGSTQGITGWTSELCNAEGLFRSWSDAGVMRMSGFTEMVYPNRTILSFRQNDKDHFYDKWLVQPIGLITTVNDSGYKVGGELLHGRLPDVWYVAPSVPGGAMWPKAPELPRRQVFSVSGLAFPWGIPNLTPVVA